MRPWRSLHAGVLAIALVAHLWMLDAPATVEDHASAAQVSVAASQPSLGGGCQGGMTACRVPMPADDVVFGLALLAMAAPWWREIWRRHPEPWGVDRPERAPPRPAVPSSVVLLE